MEVTLPLFDRTECKTQNKRHVFVTVSFPEQKDNPDGTFQTSTCCVCGEKRAITNKGELAVCIDGNWEMYDGYAS